MPKKIKTPPPGDDEPKYLAVYQPYPLNAHFELPADCRQFASWFACCVGAEDLLKFLAFFYKPKARGIILVEMDRSYKHFERLLGEHMWAKFLKNPTSEEKPRMTRVYYSTYPSGRDAQKDGWKRINVEDDWFKAWSPKNPIVHFPYPQTSWCQVPPEDKTNKPICRPLPTAVVPAPAKPAPPVVGSASWVESQTGPNPMSAQVLRGAWGRGRGRGRGGPTVSIPRSEQPIITNTPSARSPSVKSPTNAWPTSTATAIPLSVASSAGSTMSSPPGLSPLTPTSSNGTNPRIASRNGTPGASQDPLDRVQKGLDSFSLGDRSPADIYEIADEEHVDPEFVYASAWHRPLSYDDSKSSFGNGSIAESYPETQITESLWGEDDIGEKKAAEPAILCTTHGLICKKGICRDYARQLREYNKAQGVANGNRPNDSGGKKRGGKGGGWRSNQTTSDGFSVVSRGSRAKRAPSQNGNSAWGSGAGDDNETNGSAKGDNSKPTSAPAGPVVVSPEAVNYDAEDDDDNW
ncbi:hypothetical protein AB1N83_009377 [Pleurotus pulmonarius]